MIERKKEEKLDTNSGAAANDNIQSTTIQLNQEVGLIREPDLSVAHDFLSTLDPAAEGFTFQTFDDDEENKDRSLIRQLNGSLDEHKTELIRLNQAGAGVYVTVQRTDLKGRKTGNVLAVRSVFGDFDNGLPDDLPLGPSVLVQSSPGKYQSSPEKYQAWWLCDGLSFDEFAHVEECIIQSYGADKGAKDLARVLRLPGFYHNKAAPFLTRVVGGSRKTYDREEILDAFPPVEKPEPTVKFGVGGVVHDKLTDALKHVPADDYSDWLNVGFALHHEFGGSSDGYEIWKQWSSSSHKFDLSSCQAKWRSFKSDTGNPITVATIYGLAKQHGWQGEQGRLRWPKKTKDGSPRQRSQKNIRAALDHFGVTLSYDSFLNRYYERHPGKDEQELNDKGRTSLWLQVDFLGCSNPKEFFIDVVEDLAHRNTKNVCLDYLDSLAWDGTPRVGRLLIDYCQAEDTEFNRTVASRFMMAAVRRVRQPGTKFDFLLVLEGDQGLGKSSFGRILAGDPWFTDCVKLGDEPKVIIEQTSGKWFVELPELVGLRKREVETVKSMLSRQIDIARKAYGRSTSQSPRQFVFIGTTNAREYLSDPTGNRRYWPVPVGTIDLKALAADRDQLWAEACVLEAQGEDLCLPEHLWEEASKIQGERSRTDALAERIEELLSEICGVVPKNDVYLALGFEPGVSSKPWVTEVLERVATKLGWTSDRLRKPKNLLVGGGGADRPYVLKRSIDGADRPEQWWYYCHYKRRLVHDTGQRY